MDGSIKERGEKGREEREEREVVLYGTVLVSEGEGEVTRKMMAKAESRHRSSGSSTQI